MQSQNTYLSKFMKISLVILHLILFCSRVFGATSVGSVVPGLKQSCVTHKSSVVYLLEVDPDQRTIALEHATAPGCSREPVSSIVERMHAAAGLNSNNYRRGGTFNGNAVDFLKICDVIYADPGIHRTALCWCKTNQTPLIGTLNTELNFIIGSKKYIIDRINQPRQDSELVLYTPAFGHFTRTRQTGIELIIEHDQVTKVASGGHSPIPTNGMVLSIGRDSSFFMLVDKNLENLPVICQSRIILQTGKHEYDVSDFDYITSGAGLLVANGTIVENLEFDFIHDKSVTHCADEAAADFAQEKERTWLIYQQHPRTAVGILQDGSWLFVVVDGRQPGYSNGMSLPELAKFMPDHGCVYALNLGGGGCSTLVVNNIIMNSPAGTTIHGQLLSQKDKLDNERPVDAAFVIY
jgi:hypothetical protein